MRLARRDLQPLLRRQPVLLAFQLHRQLAAQHKKELPRTAVKMTRLASVRRHAFMNDAHILAFHQIPAVALLAPLIMFRVLFADHLTFLSGWFSCLVSRSMLLSAMTF